MDLAEPWLIPFLSGEAAVYTHRSPGKLADNEDCAALIPFDEESGLLVVADGLGGQPNGDVASGLAIEALCAAIKRSAAESAQLRDAILDGFESANRQIMTRSVGAATTLVVIEIRGNTIRPYHVGDSMACVMGQRGKLKLLTLSHSPVGYAVESGLLDQNEALHHEDRNIVSNVVGIAGMRIEVGAALTLLPHDTLLIASDGLFDNFYMTEIIERSRKGPLREGMRRLVAEGQRRMVATQTAMPGHADDLTLIAFRLRRR
ncbi:MAG: serine/threonine protein phosphatase [Halothiobacillaceae bacterium]|nr:MAG: serine/threonine protein phosphatase [Halothiobacillaceae bacterium]